MVNPGKRVVTEIAQPHVDGDVVTKYIVLYFFTNVDEYFVNVCNNSNQT